MKRKSSAVILLAVAALTVSSVLPGQAAAKKKAKDVKIAAVVKGLDNPFFIGIKEGIEETALKYGIRANVQAAPGLNDDVGQANKLDSLAGQNYDCYIVIPISSNNLSQAVGKITKKKKTVINIDSPIDATSLAAAGGKVTSFAGTDNFAAGEAGGKDMIAKIGTGKTIGLIAGLAGNVTSAARIDGFKKGALAADPTVKFVGPENADWDTTKALDKANAMLLANPSIAAFFAANDQMAQGISKATNIGTKKIYGVDGIADALTLVKSGKISATISQYPYVMGQMGVQACIIAAQGGKVPANTITPYYIIDSSNIDKALANNSSRGYFPNQLPPGTYDNPYEKLIKK
ncbi:MAG: sugar ABC transporter substrate-binding protein [Actinobacteria bacterium]|nr:sugar ABC transporter substrate-binding protein [Actinomycetota bacterium]